MRRPTGRVGKIAHRLGLSLNASAGDFAHPTRLPAAECAFDGLERGPDGSKAEAALKAIEGALGGG